MMLAELGSTALWLMLLLGAYHGINPGMGWLFAVALGMQQQKASAVARSLVPIAIGHALAIGSRGVGGGVSRQGAAARGHPLSRRRGPDRPRNPHRLMRHRHPRWVRMQVGFRDLIVWSFLMASAHGAGLMVLPVLLGSTLSQRPTGMARPPTRIGCGQSARRPAGHGRPHDRLSCGDRRVAWVVYRRLGLAILRKAWFNLDVLWAAALVVTGVVTLAM